MPNLVVYDTGRRVTSLLTWAFTKGIMCSRSGWTVSHISIEEYLATKEIPAGTDAVATLGILRGTGMMLKEAKATGIDYYYMDHAYYNPGYGGKGWMRITKNGHACTTLKDVDGTQFKAYKNYSIQPWRTNEVRGKKILVLPPTDAVGWFFGQRDWENYAVKEILKYMPDAEIVVRHKPNEPIVDERGFLIKQDSKEDTNPPLEQQLEDCFCVVAYNSMVALQATLMGIPVITNGNSCCIRLSFAFIDLATPEKFNQEPRKRNSVIWWLAHNQWKRRMIEDGTAWNKLQENYR